METVFVVIEHHYEDGMMSFVFWTEDDAKQFLRHKIMAYKDIWGQQGYTPIVSSLGNSITVEEQKDEIYADFWIDETEIQ